MILYIWQVMPDVTSKTEKKKKKLLSEKGFSIASDGNLNDSDIVKEQIPKAGASLMEGSTVRVYINDDAKQTVDVPDVRNKTAEVATAKFKAAGLNVRIVGNGYVLTQDPAPGTVIEKGSIVTIKCVDTTDLP